ncbi:MAG: cellulase family glycosylhydrolase [Armatimonadetes bacterium]|nr:cellulase family glycosylhydrolase [Armatimonadota bacterium]NIM23080.1 cellulase family glycosylhydrolase [Armatimonadota bacterium]NIM66948.1 cellulase family glycosylhydrolase [Armatimonadota bacterium]NIM75482.1 cellulase family glycosylhydrolase [Armatimonadota bacterium]NIN05139.1 cellulase family glycosylhydrolase [Armatimonadota bacterium]
MKRSLVRVVFCLTICGVLMLALSTLVEAGQPPPPDPITRTISMSVNEEWEKGDDLNDVALDFALVNDLGVDELRMSIGWDDYEPTNDNFDWTWLNSFCSLAATYGIKLRPYICYTPDWAGDGDWNSPPNDFNEWYEFCYELAEEMELHSNVVSFEIWNEWDNELWWSGTFAQYKTLLLNAHDAISAVYATDPDMILGGLSYPNCVAINALTPGTSEQYYEIVPFHAYAERDPRRDHVEKYFDDYEWGEFVSIVNNNGEGEPIWINEDGYSTLDRTEAMQRSYFVRAIAHFFASDDSLGEIDHYCAYEIKDLDPNAPVIGPEDVRYLGLCEYDRTKKLAFNAVKMMVSLLDDETITTPENHEVTLEATSGHFGDEYWRLIKRDEGGGDVSQVLVVYDKKNTVTCEATLTTAGDPNDCTLWNLDGTSTDWSSNFDGTTISNIQLDGREVVRVFEIGPAP